MKLQISLAHKNTHPKLGILIKSPSPEIWLRELECMELALENIQAYVLPGLLPNSVYGCMIILESHQKIKDIRSNQFCQLLQNRLFIPQFSSLKPELTDAEWQKFFQNGYCILHPEIGFYEFGEKINWVELLTIPEPLTAKVTIPSKGVFIPTQLHSLRIDADGAELKTALENPFSEAKMVEKLPFDMQKVLSGNQKEIDKFLKFLDANPEAALRMGIPLDTLNSSRGKPSGRYVFGNSGNASSSVSAIAIFVAAIVLLFVIVGIASSGGKFPFAIVVIGIFLLRQFFSNDKKPVFNSANGRSVLLDSERFSILQQKYEKLAEDYIGQKQYQKAANIYLKLLKRHETAAKVLEDGKCYLEAAYVYYTYCKDKNKAATCFELGKDYKAAASIYKELNLHEKTGDMYVKLGQKNQADAFYEIVAEDYKMKARYVKAALVYRKKMKKPERSREILLKGWRSGNDSENCLNNYFASFDDLDLLAAEIAHIYQTGVNLENGEIFIQTLKHQYNKDASLAELSNNIAYEIIAGQISKNPRIVSELVFFNRDDRHIVKDTMKFKLSSGKGI